MIIKGTDIILACAGMSSAIISGSTPPHYPIRSKVHYKNSILTFSCADMDRIAVLEYAMVNEMRKIYVLTPRIDNLAFIDWRTRDPHSSYYIPPYFSIFGSSWRKEQKPCRLPTHKVSRNVRPKGTHTHHKLYR